MGAGLCTTAEDKKNESTRESAIPSPRGAWGDTGAPSGMPLFLQPQVQMKCAGCAKQEEEEEETHHDPIQKKCAECEQEASNEQSSTGLAPDGVSGANRPLPHLDRIQASFGRHDVSGTSAAVGGAAAKANESMGSLAYTSGNRIAFRGEPDVSLAAHEAAHVVQQRNGAKLPGGVGRPGDRYEQQADAAASAVERGESAEPILDRGLPAEGGKPTAAVQHRLEASAVRVMEPAEHSSPNIGESAVAAGRAPASKTEKKDEKRVPKPDAGDPDSSGAPAGKAPAPGAQNGGSQQGGGPPAPCTSGSVAKCYKEDSPKPPDDYDGQPQNPPPAPVQEKTNAGDEADAPEPDDCPAQEAKAAAPPAAAPVGGTPHGPAASGVAGTPTPTAAAAAPKGAGQVAAAKSKGGTGKADPAKGGPAPDSQPAAAEASPIGGAISAIEDQRNIAVAGYGNSSAMLAAAAQGTPMLRAPIEFTSGANETSDETAKREAASSHVQGFFSSVADRIDSAIGLAAQPLPDQIGDQAESGKARIAASVETQKSAISASVNRARVQARGSAAGTRHAVASQASSFIASVAAQSSAAIETLTTAHSENMTQVDTLETSTLDSVNQIHSEGRTALEGLGTTVGDECTAIGQSFAGTYRTFEHCTEDAWYDGDLSERRAAAQADAAVKTAKGYHDRIVDAAKKRAKEIAKEGRKSFRCAVIGGARQGRDILDHALTDLTHAIEAVRDGAIQQAENTRDTLLSSIDSGLVATLYQLDTTEHEQRQLADDTGYMQQMMQEQLAHAGAAGLQRAVSGAAGMLQTALFELQAKFGGSHAPELAQLTEALSAVSGNIGSAMDGLDGGLDTGTARIADQLAGATASAIAALDGVTAGALEAVAQVSNGFSSSMGSIAGVDNFASQRADFGKQMLKMSTDGSSALAKVASGFKESCEGIKTDSRKALEKAGTELEQDLRQQKTGIECQITKEADEAASHEAPAWKEFLAIVLIIVVILIVIVVTVATAGAGLGFLAVVAIGAAVGAVTSALITAALNLLNNRPVLQGVAEAALIGAVTGAFGGAIGFGVGAGVGSLTQGLAKGAQLAAQYAAAMVTAGMMDTAFQYFMGGRSFDHFSWGSLGLTLLVTALTLGVAHYSPQIKVGLGIGAGARPVPAPLGETAPIEPAAGSTSADPAPVPAASEKVTPPESVEAAGPSKTTPPEERVPAPEGEAPTTPEEKDLLDETTNKNGDELTPEEAASERSIADRTKGKPIDDPPFTTERELPNGHRVRESADGDLFERCSPSCGLFNRKGERIGTVSAGPEGIVEHPASTPTVESVPAGRGPSVEPEMSATPEVSDLPPADYEPSNGEGVDDDIPEDQAEPQTTPDEQQQEFEHHADDVREQELARTSEQTTGPERERAAIDRQERGVGPRRGPAEESGSQLPDESREGNLFDDPSADPSLKPYKRPTGFPDGFREDAWEAAMGEDGIVRDPLTKKPMNPDEPWHMGHKPEHEFWRLQRQAAELGWTREQFLRAYYDLDSFWPELPESNVSHANESDEPYDGL